MLVYKVINAPSAICAIDERRCNFIGFPAPSTAISEASDSRCAFASSSSSRTWIGRLMGGLTVCQRWVGSVVGGTME